MQPLMHELLLDYARQSNEAQVRKLHVESQLKPVKPRRGSLRVRFLLGLSNALLTTGYRIRPKKPATQCC
jgi:hypothetical protein